MILLSKRRARFLGGNHRRSTAARLPQQARGELPVQQNAGPLHLQHEPPFNAPPCITVEVRRFPPLYLRLNRSRLLLDCFRRYLPPISHPRDEIRPPHLWKV